MTVKSSTVGVKRKSAVSGSCREPRAKKSLLADKPQNFYMPPTVAAMTSDDLSEWRKHQRRERNRRSAADSRNKTRSRIGELEGEVAQWRRQYEDLQAKMSGMERQIELLTQHSLSNNKTATDVELGGQQHVNPPISSNNSPPLSSGSPMGKTAFGLPQEQAHRTFKQGTITYGVHNQSITPPLSTCQPLPAITTSSNCSAYLPNSYSLSHQPPYFSYSSVLLNNSRDHATEEAEFGVWSLDSKYHDVGVEEESMKKHLIKPISRQA